MDMSKAISDDDEFEGLHEDVQMSAHRHVAAENAAQRDHEADDDVHARDRLSKIASL